MPGMDELTVAPASHAVTTMVTSAGATPARRLMMVSWLLQVVAALILSQTLFFKFTAAEESVYIFTTLGMEPWGRIGSGAMELIAVILLFIPRAVPLGALLSLGVIAGAIAGHLTKLGIVVQDDGGLLFGLALVVFACSLGILLIRRRQFVALVRAAFFGLTPEAARPPGRRHSEQR